MKKRLPRISHGLSAVVLITISAIALSSASAQLAPTWKPRQKKPLEKYDNPPAYIYRLESSPQMISQVGPFVSYHVHVDASGQTRAGDAANQWAIASAPTTPG